MALAPDEQSLPGVRTFAEKRFGGPGFGLREGGLVGTAPMIVDRLRPVAAAGFRAGGLVPPTTGPRMHAEHLAADVISQFAD
jgi:hypothetical protein